MTDPKNLESWLHEKADPARAVTADQVRERLASEHAKRQGLSVADQQCIAEALLSPPEALPTLRRAMARRNELLTPYDPAEDLTTAEAMAEFLAHAEATGDPAYIEHAREVVARARTMHGLE